jgi:hypothetical protein
MCTKGSKPTKYGPQNVPQSQGKAFLVVNRFAEADIKAGASACRAWAPGWLQTGARRRGAGRFAGLAPPRPAGRRLAGRGEGSSAVALVEARQELGQAVVELVD